MKIGIIGSGNIGGTLAGLFAAAGHDVAVANSRGPDSLADLVAMSGPRVRAATVEDSVDFGEVVVVAVPFHAYATLPADRFAGKVVVDAMNYYPARDGQVEELEADETTSSELLARRLSGARLVKAFNTMFSRRLAEEGRPRGPDRLAVFLAGDDDEAKALVAQLIDEVGFEPVDSGSLAAGGRRQQPGSDIYNLLLTGEEARRLIAA